MYDRHSGEKKLRGLANTHINKCVVGTINSQFLSWKMHGRMLT